jgi:hypothetical protein
MEAEVGQVWELKHLQRPRWVRATVKAVDGEYVVCDIASSNGNGMHEERFLSGVLFFGYHLMPAPSVSKEAESKIDLRTAEGRREATALMEQAMQEGESDEG